jgi:hypothetical protein
VGLAAKRIEYLLFALRGRTVQRRKQRHRQTATQNAFPVGVENFEHWNPLTEAPVRDSILTAAILTEINMQVNFCGSPAQTESAIADGAISNCIA